MIESVDIMSEIYELEQIRRRISERYRSDPNIRINVSHRQPRLHLRDVPVKITGVYRHILQVEETSSGKSKRRTLLMQRMEEVLTPRELNLVRSYLGIGQPDEIGMTFQELAIYLHYNGPSGAEKAYKAALRKLKKDLYGGAYGRWLSAQKAIRTAKAEAEQDAG